MILAVASYMLCVLLNWICDSQSVPFVFNANKIWQTRFEVDYISSHVMGRWIWMGSKITTRARVISLVTHKCIIEHVASLSDFQIWAWGRKKVVKLRFMMSIISWTCLSKYWTWWFGESYWFEREKNWTFILESADPQTQHCTMSILKDSLCVQFWPTSSHRKHYNPSVTTKMNEMISWCQRGENEGDLCCLRQHYFRTFGTEKLCWLLFNHVWNFFVLYFEFYRMPCTFNFLFIAIMKTVPGYISGKVPRLCCVEVICWGCGPHLFLLQLRSMWKLEVSDGILL